DFESEDWEGRWKELKSVFDDWIGVGVTIFRVDNPHTKACPCGEGAMGELQQYLTELTPTPVREFFRPNQWTNTPDILTEFLQMGGRPAFVIRLLLASTLGANYGIYGPAFELQEHLPVRHGSEEYLNSEKYEVRHWD